MKRKILVALISLCLLLSMLPLSGLAVSLLEDGATLNTKNNVSSCEMKEGCILESGHEGACIFLELPDKQTETAGCTFSKNCALKAGHGGNCMLKDEEISASNCSLTKDCVRKAEHEGECILNEKDVSSPQNCALSKDCTLQSGHEGTCIVRLNNGIQAVTPAQRASGGTAKVGDDIFATIVEALNVILQSDDKTGTVQIIADMELTQEIIIPSGADITIIGDDTAHTILREGRGTLFTVEEGAKLTIDGALLTFRQKENTDGDANMVICHGIFNLKNGTLDMNGNDINGHALGGIVTACGSEAQVIMDGGTIQNAKTYALSGGVKVCCDGTFTMNGGTICRIDGGRQLQTGAVFVYSSSGSYGNGKANFVMNGGTIENNTGYRGAGVFVLGDGYLNRSTMIMEDGTIRNNTCTGWQTSGHAFQAGGAGIYIEGNASVTMNGGNICDNTVNGGTGGGVCAVDGYWNTFPNGPDDPNSWTIEQYSQYYPAAFSMNGGTIKGNISTKGEVGADGGCGGGVYAASNCVTLKGGIIEDNKAERQGGGVYVGSIPYELKIYDAVVTENKATILGGGVWACPTGDTEIFVTNGAAVYGNTSEGAGDDVVSVKMSGRNYLLTLADRILGGGQVLWYKDGGIAADGSNLGVPDSSARYDPDNDNHPITQIQNSTQPYALKAIVSEEAKTLAQGNATLFIRGNSSARGGGIGTNGGIVMGERDNEFTLKVKKDWGNIDEELKIPVTVYLKSGETVLDPVILNRQNNWTAEFSQLPDPASLAGDFSFAVVEDPIPEHFEPVYSPAVVDEETRTITINITNTYLPNGALLISKTVSGSAGDTQKEFVFTITLSDKTIQGKYGSISFADGVASVKLKHGESIKATGLPAGVGYVIEESADGGYTVTATGQTGTIEDKKIAVAQFNNHKDIDDPKPSDPDNPERPSKPLTPDSNQENTPQTGDEMGILLWFMLAIVLGLLVSIMLTTLKNRSKE